MSKRYSLLLSFVLVLFACLFVMLSYFNRLATDDFYFIWDVKNHGILIGVISQYMEWCGRFAATFFMDIFYKWFGLNHKYYSFLAPLSALLLLAGTYTFLKNIFARISFSFPSAQRFLLSASFTALIFFLSVDTGESWFWFCSFSSYLWSIIAFVWGMAFLLSTKSPFLSCFAAILCFIYIGGASEVYTAMYGLFLTILIIYNFRKAVNLKTFLGSSFNKKLLVVYAFLGISFIIFLMAPGNYMRDGLFPERHFFYSFFITAKSFVKFAIFYFPFKLLYIVVFAFPFVLSGKAAAAMNPNFCSLSFRTFFYKLSIYFTSFLFIFFFLVAYVMVETGPPRIWFLISFVFSVYCCILCFYAGYKISFISVHLGRASNFSIITGVVLMSCHLFTQYHSASHYAAAYDQRTYHILELNKIILKDTLITLEPFPPSGMLYSAEISADTAHFTNKELRLGYDLKYHVALRK